MVQDFLRRRQELEALKPHGWVNECLQRFETADPLAAAVGRGLLGHPDRLLGEVTPEQQKAPYWGMGASTRESNAERAAFARLETLSFDQLSVVLRGLFPRIANELLAAWSLLGELSYQQGFFRQPFRAPRHADCYRHNRDYFLGRVIQTLKGHDPDLDFLVKWGPQLTWGGLVGEVGLIFAAASSERTAEGDRHLARMIDTLNAGASSGEFGRWVITGLLAGRRPEGWDAVVAALRAAERQEGLRQAILETADVSQVGAFSQVLRTVEEEGMGRFASVVRAVDVWAGLMWDSAARFKVEATLSVMRSFLDDEDARSRAVTGDDAEKAYFGLWASAVHDAMATIPLASRLRSHPRPEFRWVGAHLLSQLRLEPAQREAVPFLSDQDLRVSARVLDGLGRPMEGAQSPDDGRLAHLRTMLANCDTGKVSSKPLVWPWVKVQFSADHIARSLVWFGGRAEVVELAGRIDNFDVETRRAIVAKISSMPMDAELRAIAIDRLQDAAPSVRGEASKVISGAKIVLTPAEAEALEPLLDRKAADLRKSLISLLAAQGDEHAISSVRRLLARKSAEARIAGLELLVSLLKASRCSDEARTAIDSFRQTAKKAPGGVEQRLLETVDSLLSPATAAPPITLENALGLLEGQTRTEVIPPRRHDVRSFSEAADALLGELDELVHRHREAEVEQPNGERTTLGGMDKSFPSRHWLDWRTKKGPELPLADVWRAFWTGRRHHDPDGQELARMILRLISLGEYGYLSKPEAWILEVMTGKGEPPTLRYTALMSQLVTWFESFEPGRVSGKFVMDVLEDLTAQGPPPSQSESQWAVPRTTRRTAWSDLTAIAEALYDTLAPAEHTALLPRRWAMARWNDEPVAGFPPDRPNLSLATLAHAAGVATDGDLYDLLLKTRSGTLRAFSALAEATGSYGHGYGAISGRIAPATAAVIDRTVRRIVDIETRRSESVTPATRPALSLGRSGGLETVVLAFKCLDKDDLTFGPHLWTGSATSTTRPAVMTHLLNVSAPGPEDTPEAFTRALKPLNLPPKKIVGLAVLNPAWARHVQAMLGWDSLDEAVWWVYAHSRGMLQPWGEGKQVVAEIARRTPVRPEELTDGAVDVAWFRRVYEALGTSRWELVDAVANLATGGGTGHTRARLFADALRDSVSRSDLIARVKTKRNQDAVRALGLIPLEPGKAARKDLHERYQVLQEFVRTSKQFGSQRQASEKRAAAIGMDNLARTAGYPDPIRLSWAMEAQSVQDIGKGPVSVTQGQVTVSLAVADGEITLQAEKAGKPLKEIPPGVKKAKPVAELVARKSQLTQSASRMRSGLEESMIRGDPFRGDELRDLWQNVLIRPLLERLVFLGEGICGYPVDGGKGLRDHAGKIEPIKPTEALRIAHAHDLLAGGKWSQWQRECLAAERVQPFKQVFRELYVATDSERNEKRSRRFAGQQVQPRQALALLGTRGWVFAAGEGVSRTFHAEGITAMLSVQEAFHTPAEVDGITLEGVHFFARGSHEALACGKVPPRLFSEVMRDMDLVVSVAHRGGVDPEASQSTVELRTALVQETAQLLGLKNVRVKGRHVHISGTLADYAVHLGSAETHLVPGGAIVIVAVQSQHRGRIFLPFADSDPKTAEALSKVLLLARDGEIKDPNLVDQIESRRG